MLPYQQLQPSLVSPHTLLHPKMQLTFMLHAIAQDVSTRGLQDTHKSHGTRGLGSGFFVCGWRRHYNMPCIPCTEGVMAQQQRQHVGCTTLGAECRQCWQLPAVQAQTHNFHPQLNNPVSIESEKHCETHRVLPVTKLPVPSAWFSCWLLPCSLAAAHTTAGTHQPGKEQGSITAVAAVRAAARFCWSDQVSLV